MARRWYPLAGSLVALFVLMVLLLAVVQPPAAEARPQAEAATGRLPNASILFADDFSTDKGWHDESGGAIYRDELNEWLVWNVHRSETRRHYHELSAASDYVELAFRVNVTAVSGNSGVQVALVEDRAGTPTQYFHATGIGVGIGRNTSYGPRINLFGKYADGTTLNAPTPDAIAYSAINTWLDIRLQIEDDQATITAWDEGGTELGVRSFSLPQRHSIYNYVGIFNDGEGGWENSQGLLDDITVTGGPPADQRPVILVPGMLASVNWKWRCLYLRVDCGSPEDWEWTPLPQGGTAEWYYRPLIQRFEEAGYTRDNHSLTVVLYDWRAPIDDNVGWLKAAIEAAKTATGESEVDIIGHSMGGLLARAYIQDDAYGGMWHI